MADVADVADALNLAAEGRLPLLKTHQQSLSKYLLYIAGLQSLICCPPTLLP